MFDPTLPANGSPLLSAEMRAQLNGLKDLIDAVPTISGAVVDAVNTLDPGNPATAQTSFDGSNVHFTFGIPRGTDGTSATPVTTFVVDAVNILNPWEAASVQASFDGSAVHFVFNIPRGADGSPGMNGGDGAPGAPFTNFVVDGVTTLNPGSNAAVVASYDGSAVRFQFSIPRGEDGATGPPGEVTSSALASAINGTSSNSNSVSLLNLTVSDPPTQGEVQSIANKIDELIAALRR